MEESCRLDMIGKKRPPTVRCVNCGYINDSVFRVNRFNFHTARILDPNSGLRAASQPHKQHPARGV